MDIDAWLDQHDAWVTDTVRTHGWAIQYVGGGCCSMPGCDAGPDDEPPFAYTTGLFGLGHPELLITDVDAVTAATVLNSVARRVLAGEHLVPGIPIDVDGWPTAFVPEPVTDPGELLVEANRFYRRPAEHSVPALRLDPVAG